MKLGVLVFCWKIRSSGPAPAEEPTALRTLDAESGPRPIRPCPEGLLSLGSTRTYDTLLDETEKNR